MDSSDLSNKPQSAGPVICDPMVSTLDAPTLNVDIGISRRDWFAAMAMQSLCADQDVAEVAQERNADFSKIVAVTAVTFADALIKELDKSK